MIAIKYNNFLIIIMFRRLWGKLRSRRKRQFILLVFLMIFVSAIEVVSIGLVLPFLGVVTNPEVVFNHALSQPLIEYLDIKTKYDIITPVVFVFIVAIIVAGVVRILLLYGMSKFSYGVGSELGVDAFNSLLHQSYDTYLKSNSSDSINSIVNKSHAATVSLLTPSMHIISYLIFIVGVFILLFSASKEATFGVFSSIGLIYLTISILSRKRIKENGKKISQLSTAVIKKMQEGIGSIRDILIDNSQKVFVREFEKINFSYRNAQGNNYFISLAPRYFVETVSIVMIVIISYFMLIKIGSNSVIPILGMIALSSQKLIPAIQQVYMSYINIVGAKESLNDLFKILESPLLNSDKNPRIDRKPFFSKKIKLKNVSFRYNSDSQLILNNVNLTINKGDFLGVIGGTGQGKSTLVDIMMTLLSPSSGDLFFDEKKMDDKALWRGLISHVPQSIFLIDGSIYQNIAFGVDVEDIDHNLAKGAAKLACIFDDIKAFPDGFETNIGENGCRLSGGQRQRIGIARAMYRNSEVLILDEATSALDIVTEEKVINSLKNIDNKKTVIIITHKEASLKWCNRVIEVKNGSIVERIGTNILMSNKIENG